MGLFHTRSVAGLTLSKVCLTIRYRDVFFCVLFSGFSDPRAEWPKRNSSRNRISGRGCTRVRGAALLVRAYPAMVFERVAHADAAVLGGHRSFAPDSCKYLAARHADRLLCLFSFLRQRGRRFF